MAYLTKEELVSLFYSDEVIQNNIPQLKTLISKKSIFAQQIGLEDVALYLKKIFVDAGAEVTVDKSYCAPFVIARFMSSNPDAKTVIFYNHYDTVPADNDQVWTASPFELDIRGDYMFARGIDDDKGHIIARLTALQKYQLEVGPLPVNVTFIIEGAEESASVDLEKYLQHYKSELSSADLLLWEQGDKNELNQLELTGGNKGIITFDLSVESANVDIHSKYGGVIESASWYLLNAIASMRSEDGKILIEGIYENIKQPTERELKLVEQYAVENNEKLAEIYGLTLPPLKEERKEFLKTYFFEPALNIEGIWSGYLGKGVKPILPAKAMAKMELRLVPGLKTNDVFDKIKNHLIKNGFDKVTINYTLGEESYRSDMTHPKILEIISLAEGIYPEGVSILPTSPGTGPMHTVFEALEVPMVAFGMGNANSRDHGGDENIAIEDYVSHILLVKELIKQYE